NAHPAQAPVIHQRALIPECRGPLFEFVGFPLAAYQVDQVQVAIITQAPVLKDAEVVALLDLLCGVANDAPPLHFWLYLVFVVPLGLDMAAALLGRSLLVGRLRCERS